MPDWLGPLSDQIGVVAALAIVGLIGLWRMERTDRKEAEARERESTKTYTASINDLTRAIENQGRRNG